MLSPELKLLYVQDTSIVWVGGLIFAGTVEGEARGISVPKNKLVEETRIAHFLQCLPQSASVPMQI